MPKIKILLRLMIKLEQPFPIHIEDLSNSWKTKIIPVELGGYVKYKITNL